MTLHHFDLRGRVRMQLLTYVDMSGWKVSIVLLSANSLWDMLAVKNRCVCTHFLTHETMIMCSFEHNFPLVHLMRRVYKIVSTARRDDVQVFTKKTHLCTSLTYVDTSMFNFWHMWTCLSGKFPLFLLIANGLWGVFIVKQRVST